MDMLKSYAHQVASYLPAKQRDEVFAEIYDSFCEEYADLQAREPGLDQETFLEEHKGHPMRYATGLAADYPAYLVGPQFYFSFISALKVAMSIVFIVYLVIAVAGTLAGGSIWRVFLGAMAGMPFTMLWVAAAVLGVFVALEKSGERASWLDQWDVSELSKFSGHQAISRGETSFDLGFSIFALLLVLDVVAPPSLIRQDGAWLSGEWTTGLPGAFWWPVTALLVFDLLFSLYRFTRSHWTPRLRLATIIGNIAWLGVLTYAFAQPELIRTDLAEARQMLPLVERAAKGVLLVVWIIVAWDTVSHARKYWKQRAG